MLGNRFYNQSLRKLIVAFGQVFNNIVIQRTNSTGGVTSRIKVPLAYAPKEKFMVRLDQQANLNSREFATSLPRMGFEITGLSYDASRKLTRVQKYSQVKSGEEGKKVNFNYTPVVYLILALAASLPHLRPYSTKSIFFSESPSLAMSTVWKSRK